jgi:hypothetical protein
MARFSYLSGNCTWRDGSQGSWSSATVNLPVRQGAQIWVADGGRAEIQFDDGSRMRLGGNTFITLQTLYSDSQGEFTEINLNNGQTTLRLKHQYSLYQINTPYASLKCVGPARVRTAADPGTQFAVLKGQATVEGNGGKVTLNSGNFLDLPDANAPYTIQSLPPPSAWDSWNGARDRQLDVAAGDVAHRLPPNIAVVGDDLDAYGSWHTDPTYGEVWAPRVTASDWRPYGYGHWTWVEPFGWTWVSDESWGWAPYHYGTWISRPYGWAWVPGPVHQYWSPAVVSFSQRGDDVAWVPLAPAEVHYPPTLSVGFSSGNWSAFFSIGGAAVYYPTVSNVYVSRAWPTNYVNRVTYVNNVTNINNTTIVRNITVNRNTYVGGGFVPINARAFGATRADIRSFGGRAVYRPVTRRDLTVFTHGRAIGAPANGLRPVAGPQRAPVTPLALTPTRVYHPPTQVPQRVVSRAVYRAPLPAAVPHTRALPGQRFAMAAPRSAARPVATARPPASRTTPGRPAPPSAAQRQPAPPMRSVPPAVAAARRSTPSFRPLMSAARPQPSAPAARPGPAGPPRNMPGNPAHNAARPQPGRTSAPPAHNPNENAAGNNRNGRPAPRAPAPPSARPAVTAKPKAVTPSARPGNPAHNAARPQPNRPAATQPRVSPPAATRPRPSPSHAYTAPPQPQRRQSAPNRTPHAPPAYSSRPAPVHRQAAPPHSPNPSGGQRAAPSHAQPHPQHNGGGGNSHADRRKEQNHP